MMESLQQIDLRLFHFVNSSISNQVFDMLCPLFRHKLFLVGCYLVFLAVVYKFQAGNFIKILIAGALCFAITDQLSASVIKTLAHRLRPCNDAAVNARLIIEYCGSGFSFVSAHAANSFGMASFLTLILKRKTVSCLLLLWAFLVSFSQVYVGVHYPGDVIGGAILGLFVGSIVALVLKSRFEIDRKKAGVE